MPNPSAYILYPCTKTFWILAIYFEGKQIILTISKSEILLKIMACSKIVEAIQNCLKAFKSIWRHPKVFEGFQIILLCLYKSILKTCNIFWRQSNNFDFNQKWGFTKKMAYLDMFKNSWILTFTIIWMHPNLFEDIQNYLKALKLYCACSHFFVQADELGTTI